MRTGFPCNESRFFPVGIDLRGKAVSCTGFGFTVHHWWGHFLFIQNSSRVWLFIFRFIIYSIKCPDFSIPHLPQSVVHKLHFVEMAQIYRLLETRHKLVIIQTLKRFLIARFFPCSILEHMLSFVDICSMIVQPWFDQAQWIKATDKETEESWDIFII